jgi:hypothetical protein
VREGGTGGGEVNKFYDPLLAEMWRDIFTKDPNELSLVGTSNSFDKPAVFLPSKYDGVLLPMEYKTTDDTQECTWRFRYMTRYG